MGLRVGAVFLSQADGIAVVGKMPGLECEFVGGMRSLLPEILESNREAVRRILVGRIFTNIALENDAVRRRPTAPFAVGGKVYIRFAGKKHLARILEDRGGIGIGGRQLLRVAFIARKGEVEEAFEIPAAEVTPFRSLP